MPRRTRNAIKSEPTSKVSLVPANGSAYGRNKISGEKYPLPRLMWADCDPDDRKTPIVTYDSKSDQRGTRPDLKPVRVAVVSLDKNLGEIMTDIYNAWQADRESRRRTTKLCDQ